MNMLTSSVTQDFDSFSIGEQPCHGKEGKCCYANAHLTQPKYKQQSKVTSKVHNVRHAVRVVIVLSEQTFDFVDFNVVAAGGRKKCTRLN